MKKNQFIYSWVLVLLVVTACSKNDDNPPGANRAPDAFNLLTVSNNAMDVNVSPTLTWETATDPDGDPVVYDVYLDKNNNPISIVVNDLNSTQFTISDRLNLKTNYSWKVVAKDDQGNQTECEEIFSFTTREISNGTEAITSAGFSARLQHTSVFFDNKFWVIGGYDGSDKNDVWSSTNGSDWQQITNAANFSPRSGHTSLVFDNKMWVIGGAYINDVWYSNNGANWTQATSSAPFSLRGYHSSVVFDNKMWVIGGFINGTTQKNDVWYSSDGVIWIEATPAAGFLARYFHTSLVYDNKIWVIGGSDGTNFNDVWSSSDGVNWTLASPAAGFSPRGGLSSLVFDDKLWVVAGQATNELWYSNNGITWTLATDNASFSPRGFHTSLTHDNKIWVIGGYDINANFKNDVWYLD